MHLGLYVDVKPRLWVTTRTKVTQELDCCFFSVTADSLQGKRLKGKTKRGWQEDRGRLHEGLTSGKMR